MKMIKVWDPSDQTWAMVPESAVRKKAVKKAVKAKPKPKAKPKTKPRRNPKAKAKKAKRPTFRAARDAILKHLEAEGWEVKKHLKTPTAYHRDQGIKYWFKPQAVYGAVGSTSFGDARSTWADIRDIEPEEFAAGGFQRSGHEALFS